MSDDNRSMRNLPELVLAEYGDEYESYGEGVFPDEESATEWLRSEVAGRIDVSRCTIAVMRGGDVVRRYRLPLDPNPTGEEQQ